MICLYKGINNSIWLEVREMLLTENNLDRHHWFDFSDVVRIFQINLVLIHTDSNAIEKLYDTAGHQILFVDRNVLVNCLQYFINNS